MPSFEELIEKAIKQLDHPDYWNANTTMYRGIGYALLALAIAIKAKVG